MPQAVSHLAPIERLRASDKMKLAISLPLRDQQGLANLLIRLYDPSSPDYRKFLTPAQFTEKFGPSVKDYQAVIDFARAHGLNVTHRHANRVVLDVEGSVSDIEKTLNVKMHTYEHPKEKRKFFAPDAEPTVDPPVPLLQISGLDNYSMPRPALRAKPALQGGAAAPATGSAPGGGFAGNDFRAAYLPGVTITGSGQSIGLLEFDGYYASDITAYENQFDLPQVPLVNVPVDGGVITTGTWNSEVALDIEMAISMTPGVSAIYVYEAPNTTGLWIDLLSRMANDNLAKQLSCSWYSFSTAPFPAAEQIFQQMAAQGQSFLSASGDGDAFTGGISFPEDSPNITQVGGTTLTTTGPGGSYVSEKVWNWGYNAGTGTYWGSSGGISPYYTIPNYQQDVSMMTNQGSTTMRNIPDVALTADNVYVRYNNGGTGNFGGTSCAAPLWAAFIALVNQRAAENGRPPVGFLNPALYAAGKDPIYASLFHDTATGNNFSSSSPSKYSATGGYDLCTGWGTPAGSMLIDALAGPADTLQVTPPTSLASSGLTGGPFSNSAVIYTLSNYTAAPLEWHATPTQSWLTLSASNGTLPAGGSVTVVASLTAAANSLPAGSYTDAITFSNDATGFVHTRTAKLDIATPSPVLSVTPAASFAAAGTVGGPFTPSTATYIVSNTGNVPMDWSVSKNSNWLTVSPANGTIAVNGSATVTATISSSANSLAVGSYPDTLTFTNLSNGAGNTTRGVSLSVLAPTAPVITVVSPVTGSFGTYFYYQIVANNSPTSYSASGLPPGLTVSTATGVISGTPTKRGTFNATVSATNSLGTGTATLTIIVQTLVGWGWNFSGQISVPPALSNVVAVAGGWEYSLALKANGTVVGWGADSPAYHQTIPPEGLSNAIAIAAAPYFGLALKSNGTVIGWGDNEYGQLTPPAGLNNAVAIAAAGFHCLALRADGTVVVWGQNSTGVFAVPAGLKNVVAIAAGYGQNVALKDDGTVAAWGDDTYQGTEVPTGLNNVVAIAAGDNIGLALKADGTVVSWGNTGSVPPGINNVVGIAAGSGFFLALKSDGTVKAWGDNSQGQTTVPTGLGNVVAITGGGYHSLGLTGDEVSGAPPSIISALKVLGSQYPFQYRIVARNSPTSYGVTGLPSGLSLNTSTGLISGSPVQTGTYNVTLNASNAAGTGSAILNLIIMSQPNPPVITSGSTASGGKGSYFSYQITATNFPSSYGATGLPSGVSVNTSTGLISGTPTVAGTFNTTVSATNARGSGTAALTLTIQPSLLPPVITSGTTASGTFASAFSYQITATNSPTGFVAAGLPAGLSVNAASGLISGTLTQSGSFRSTISAVNASGTGSAILAISVPTVIAWGANDYGQTTVPASANDIVAIAAGFYHVLCLKSDGTVISWGQNYSGQTAVPAGLTDVTAIAAGWSHSLALRNDGTVVAWGSNTYLQSTVPQNLGSVVAIAGGGFHSLALKSDGSVTGWGANFAGQTNDPGLSNVMAIAAGWEHSLALKSDGTVAAWGYNSSGQTTVPTGLRNVVEIAAGRDHNLALRSDGTVVAWGSNGSGQRNVPAGLSNVVAISAGYAHSMALKWDGTVVIWGDATYGQTTPPPGLNSVVAISSGAYFNVALMGIDSNVSPPVFISSPTAMGPQNSFQYRVVAKNNPTSYGASGLPAGLSVNTATGLISGTAVTSGTSNATITATNSNGTSSVTLKLIVQKSAPIITSALTASGAPGEAFSYQITAIGDPTGYAAGNLPAGLSVNTSTGLISGTPSASGITNASISATNPVGTGTAILTITITNPPPVITSGTTATAVQGKAFSYPVTATNSPVSYGAAGLPAGLTINTTTGLISGTATIVGTSNATISATNLGGTGSATLTISVVALLPVITSGTSATALQGQPFSYQITAANSPTSFGATDLPAGLSVNTATGLISGTVASSGTTNATISATNTAGTGTALLRIAVTPPQAPTITSSGSASGTLASGFSYQITAANLPTSFNATGLVPGLSVNASTGLISGTLLQTGSFTANITASNAGGTGAAALVINIQDVAAWGINNFDQSTVPACLDHVRAIASSSSHSVVLKEDGTVLAWGKNSDGQATVPAGLNNVVAIAAGGAHTLALKSDGKVVAWGSNVSGQIDVPAGLSRVAGISAGNGYSLALKTDGTVVVWGDSTYKQRSVPSGLNNVVMAVAGSYHCLALKSDGTVVGWGTNNYGETVTPPGLGNVVAIAAGMYHSVALKADGTVVAWGSSVSGANQPPAGLSGVLAISAGGYSNLALKREGTITGWGMNTFGQITIPLGLDGVMTLSIGGSATLALTGTGGPEPVIISPATVIGSLEPLQYRIVAKNNPAFFGATGLPSGLTIDPATGIISGTPVETGTSNVTIRATNANGTGSTVLTVIILRPPPVITSTLTATATKGVAFSYQIKATNAPVSYTATGLPAGLSIDTATGLISGTAMITGTASVTISATNENGMGSANLAITILLSPPLITSGTNATAIQGQPFSYQITASNSPTAYDATGLPAGFGIDTSTGLISGTATASGTSSVTIYATNSGGTSSATLLIVVQSPYSAWQNTSFTTNDLLDPAISSGTATPAHDGVPNLLKYALGLSPKVSVSGGNGLPVVTTTTAGGIDYLTLTYTQILSATDITYLPEVSSDMKNWNSGTGYTMLSGSTNPGGLTKTMTAQDLTPTTAPKRFIRLKITRP